jgi:AAA15 family ATPase/GTPase
LGRVTVFIGENGCGKSNILEAIALGSAAAADKLDNEFLASRGIRVTDPKLMRSAFEIENSKNAIKINLISDSGEIFYTLQNKNIGYSKWTNPEFDNFDAGIHEVLLAQEKAFSAAENFAKIIEQFKNVALKEIDYHNIDNNDLEEKEKQSLEKLNKGINNLDIAVKTIRAKLDESQSRINENYDNLFHNFLIYNLENKSLRTFEKEGQVEPLGIYGEGLFKYLRYLSQPQFKEKLDQIKEKLELIDWFEDFDIPENLYPGERTLKLKDRYLDPDLEYFDQKSANEGFLFLLFYFCLFIGEETPKFFAIDNIDSSLNPLLCRRLIEELVELAKKHDKQVILTTHNPAALDGLDLHDEEQKLYVISRKLSGHTRADQVFPPKAPEGKKPVRLSEAFLRGYIGGLPENF